LITENLALKREDKRGNNAEGAGDVDQDTSKVKMLA